MKRFFLICLTLALALVLLAGCGAKRTVKFIPTDYLSSSGEADAMPVMFGFCAKGEGGIEDAVIAHIQQSATEKGFDVQVRYAENSAEKQAENIESLISEGAMCLIVNPVDIDGLDYSMDYCTEMGIKVINLLEPINGKVDCLICPDYSLVGKKGARLAREADSDNGYDSLNVYLLENAPDSFTMQLMHDGFKSELGDSGSIKGVRHFEPEAEAELAGLDRAELESSNVVFAFNEALASSVSGSERSVICWGASSDTLQKISSKDVYAAVFYGPCELADKALAEAMAYANDPEYAMPAYVEVSLGVASESSVDAYIASANGGYPEPAQ